MKKSITSHLFQSLLVWFAICRLFYAGVTCAQTIHVDGNTGNDSRTGLDDWSNAVKTISNGVARAATHSADTVLVSTGLYQVTTNIVVTNAITLRSWNGGALDPTNTIIDGQSGSRCLYLNHTSALVAGFTFTNGNGVGELDNHGGGVRMGGLWNAWTAGGTLSNCIVTGNTAMDSGGGVLAFGRNSIVTHCRFTGNVAGNGGGAYVYPGIIRECTLDNNNATSTAHYSGGGGLFLKSDNRAGGVVVCMADTCRIVGNKAYACGGGVLMMGSTNLYLNNSVVSNNAQTSDANALYSAGGVYLHLTQNALICGTTIKSNSGYYGGGIVFRYSGNGQGGCVSNCVVSDNIARNRGGGVYDSCSDTDTIPDIEIIDTIVEGNSDNSRAGGVYLRRGATLDGCRIRNNTGNWYGGVYIEGAASGTSMVRNCLIIGNTNTGTDGTAGLTIPSNTFVQNCTVISNVALDAINGKGGVYFTSEGGVVSNSIIMFNLGTFGDNWAAAAGVTPRMDHSCTAPTNGLTGAGNLESDPLFGDGDGRLSSGSPCVNAGTNEEWMADGVDLDGWPRIDRFMRKVDMGCYEFMPRGCMFNFR